MSDTDYDDDPRDWDEEDGDEDEPAIVEDKGDFVWRAAP
jgi:hypothetical protein